MCFSCGRVGGCQEAENADFVWSSTHSPSDFHPNYGYESLAYDSVRHLLWSISRSTLRNDGEPASWQNGEANRLRLFAFDWSERSETSSMFGSVRHPIAVSYAYRMDAPAMRKRPQTYAMGVSEFCVCFLMDSFSCWSVRCMCPSPREVLPANASFISSILPRNRSSSMSASFASDDVPYVRKTLLTQWSTRLTLLGRSFANYEGMCLGPQLADGSQALILLSDSQDQYAGVLKDWFKTIVLSREDFLAQAKDESVNKQKKRGVPDNGYTSLRFNSLICLNVSHISILVFHISTYLLFLLVLFIFVLSASTERAAAMIG